MSNTDTKAATANRRSYDSLARERYIDGAPHIRHGDLRQLYHQLARRAFEEAQKHSPVPRVLDLGAGEGSVTATYLSLGAEVTAVDISEGRLRQLKEQCKGLSRSPEIICAEAFGALEFLANGARKYDLIAVTAFLHHVPDYQSLLRKAVSLLTCGGQLVTFEDPLRYDSLGWSARMLAGTAYFSWRVCQGDLLGGTRRYLRRRLGNNAVTEEDDVEYHVVRNGVDQDAVQNLLGEMGLKCDVVRYFSTQAPLWQAIGRHLGLANSFAVLAQKGDRVPSD